MHWNFTNRLHLLLPVSSTASTGHLELLASSRFPMPKPYCNRKPCPGCLAAADVRTCHTGWWRFVTFPLMKAARLSSWRSAHLLTIPSDCTTREKTRRRKSEWEIVTSVPLWPSLMWLLFMFFLCVFSFAGEGVLVCSIDNMPAQIPREATDFFGSMLLPLMPDIVSKHIQNLDSFCFKAS